LQFAIGVSLITSFNPIQFFKAKDANKSNNAVWNSMLKSSPSKKTHSLTCLCIQCSREPRNNSDYR
jgi:hypothetical protein